MGCKATCGLCPTPTPTPAPTRNAIYQNQGYRLPTLHPTPHPTLTGGHNGKCDYDAWAVPWFSWGFCGVYLACFISWQASNLRGKALEEEAVRDSTTGHQHTR